MGLNKKLLLVGGQGMLAQKVTAAFAANWDISAVDLPDFDLTDQDQVADTVADWNPELIINCAAFTDVDGCETQEALASRVNGIAVGSLAAAALEVGATLVHVSTDYVFAGTGNIPLSEEERPEPLSAYGRSKLLGEQAVLASGLERYFILRTSWLYGPGGNNFVETILRLAGERERLGIVADQFGSPTYTGDLAAAMAELVAVAEQKTPHGAGPPPYGTYHFSNRGDCCWYDFAVEIVRLARQAGDELKVSRIDPIATADYPLPAPRPAYSVFSREKYSCLTGREIPTWQESLKYYFRERNKAVV